MITIKISWQIFGRENGNTCACATLTACRKSLIHECVTSQRRWRADFGIAKDNGAYYLPLVNTISLKLPDHLLERLEAESHARGTTKSSLVRECLEKTLNAGPQGGKASCYDLARDLAGSLKGLPRDLATNPKYLEGFGE